jgi:hypothetical protein
MVQCTIFPCNQAYEALNDAHAALQQNIPSPETGSEAALDKDD